MRSLTILLMVAFSTKLAFAQDLDTHIVDGRLIYQHVFKGDLERPLSFIETLKGISNVRELDGVFYGDWYIHNQELRAAMRAVGLTYLQTMIFLSQPEHSSQVKFEVREGRYRVTVSDILCRFESETVSDTPIETYLLKSNGQTRPKQFGQTRDIYNYLATSLFSGHATTPTNDDW